MERPKRRRPHPLLVLQHSKGVAIERCSRAERRDSFLNAAPKRPIRALIRSPQSLTTLHGPDWALLPRKPSRGLHLKVQALCARNGPPRTAGVDSCYMEEAAGCAEEQGSFLDKA